MADFNININSQDFFVNNILTQSTDCSTIYEYSIIAIDTQEIIITLTGDHTNETYTLNGVTTSFTDTVTLVYNTSLTIRFSLPNSGISGYFNNTTLSIENTDTLSSISTYNFNLERENDSVLCESLSAIDSFIDNVQFAENLLTFTGVESAFSGIVDLSSLVGTPPIDLLPTTQIFDLGEIGASLIENAFNAFVFPVNVQNQIDGYVIINTLRSGTLVQYLFLAEGGDYGSGGVLTAIAADFAELSNLNVNLTWQHASNTSGASSSVTEKLIAGQATSFTSVVVHNAAIMSPEMVTNTMKNKGFAGLDIGGNGSGSSVFAVRLRGINPNNGNVEIGDSTNDINTWNPVSEGRKNTVSLKRSFKPSAGATLTSAGDFQFTGVYANNPVNFDVNGEDPDSYYAAFESNPIITGTHLPANPDKIFALRGVGRMLLSDYGSGNVTEEVATHGLGVSANGRVVETALRVVGGLYLTTSIETVITTINTPVKVLGTTTGLTLNERLTATDNRLTYVGLQPTILNVTGTYAVDAGNNAELSFYIAKNGSILAETKSSVRVGVGGDERQGTITGLIEMVDTDYVEIWVENNGGTGNLTCLALNLNAMG